MNLDKPLVRRIFIGKIEQSVLYEGINALCFSCGRIGHKLEACPYIIKEQSKERNKDQCEVHNEKINIQEEEGLKDRDKDNAQEEYGEWMVVNRKKMNSRKKPVQNSAETNHLADVQLTQASSATATNSRVAGQNDRNGKRKILHTQSAGWQKGTNVMAMSSQSQSKTGKSSKDKSTRAKTNQKATCVVGMQSKVVGQSKNKGVFVFGAEAEPGPFCFSSPSINKVSPSDSLENPVAESSGTSDGEQRKLGDLLQRKGDSGGKRDNPLDKARSNGCMGLVRARPDGGVEEHVSVDGEKQATGVSANERRSMDHDSGPVVEILDGSASSAGATSDKLKVISHRIKHAELRKISVGSGNGVDRVKSRGKEDDANGSGGMLIDGQSKQGEDDPVCRTGDEWHDSDQGYSGRAGDNKTCGDSIPGELGVEEGANGAMEIQRH